MVIKKEYAKINLIVRKKKKARIIKNENNNAKGTESKHIAIKNSFTIEI